MKILLLTDIPPCRNFTAGLVLDRLISFLRLEEIVLCAVINSDLRPEIPMELESVPHLWLRKPREDAVRIMPRVLGGFSAFVFEVAQGTRVRHVLLPRIAAFARQQQVDALWVVLQGQTMIRLAILLADYLHLPLFTQIWDPFEWWLRANKIDKVTQRRLLSLFDKVIKQSTACATASWAMSEAYSKQYAVRNLPVIAGLPAYLARSPAQGLHSGGEFIIGMAGQFYAQAEWACLIHALNNISWTLAGRKIRLRVLGAGFQSYTQIPANFEYLGWHTQDDTIRLLAEADLLYMPYWFSNEFYREASFSFPSKLVTYFAAGRPVFCHAPAYASPARYIAKYDAGYLCQSLDPSAVLNLLEKVISDTNTYARLAQNGTACFLQDFTLERMRETFFEFLGLNGVEFTRDAL